MKEKDYAIQKLQELCPPGTMIYTSVEQVSRSGMSRHIKTFISVNNEILNITYFVARALGYRISDKTGGLVVSGCGMDMGFHVVMNLSYAIHGHGIGYDLEGRERDEAQRKPQADNYVSGYSLHQRWM